MTKRPCTNTNLPDATAYGYERIGNDGLQPKTMAAPQQLAGCHRQQPAAPELLNDLVCDCQPDACAVDCSCLDSGQPCTSACNCEASVDGEDGQLCANPLTLAAFDNDSDSDDE